MRPTYSHPLCPIIIAQWRDWEKGIVPTREHRGRGAQNPWLLRAFLTLDGAKARLERAANAPRAREDRGSFERRVLSEVGNA